MMKNSIATAAGKGAALKRKSVIIAALALLAGSTACGQPRNRSNAEKSMKVIELNKSEFQRKVYDFEKNPDNWKYEGQLPAVIDFYATWCGPCKAMAPVMDQIAEEYEGKIVVYKVDVDKEQRLASIFGVRSIPTFLFIPLQGDPRHANGAMDIASMRKIIDQTLLVGQQQ